MKKINIILIVFFYLTSCTGFKEAGKVLRNEKVSSTDEFLVKKRDPLILPPNYEDLPKPNSKKTEINKEKKNPLKKILNASNDETSSKNSSSSTEKTILNRIRN
tara:strand:- start:569 stop:880 length:312 start_codon:yes stop_codon:yes gene_type:complete